MSPARRGRQREVAMTSRLHLLTAHGQSVWIDFLSRDVLQSYLRGLERLVGIAAGRARYRRSQTADPHTQQLRDAVCSGLEHSHSREGDFGLLRSGHEGDEMNDPEGDLMFSLYQAEWCPHSHRVRQRLTELGLDFVAHQVPVDPAERMELEHATGRRSIPTLVLDDGSILGGDDEIIATLDLRFAEPLEAARHRAKAVEEWPEWLRLFGSG
jgi:glutaredoxin